MSVSHDKEALLDALYEHHLDTGKRPSIYEAQMRYLPEWDRDRLFNAAKALENDGDILNLSHGLINVDLSSTARKRAQSRANPPALGTTNYNIGSVHNSPIQHVATGGNGVQSTQYGLAVSEIRSVIELYRQHVEELSLDAVQRQKADKAVATIEAQLVDNDPDQGIVEAAGRSLKSIVEGAIGGALGNAAANPGVWALLFSLF